MKATVTIEKSFDSGRVFGKTWKSGDLEKFFSEEGSYLDNLGGILNEKGKPGDEFVVIYTVRVTK